MLSGYVAYSDSLRKTFHFLDQDTALVSILVIYLTFPVCLESLEAGSPQLSQLKLVQSPFFARWPTLCPAGDTLSRCSHGSHAVALAFRSGCCDIHVNARSRGFPEEHCSITRLLFTSPVILQLFEWRPPHTACKYELVAHLVALKMFAVLKVHLQPGIWL